ncbi:amidase family protein [Bradyrhizobium sp. CB1717]|nr:amidase family protein [Bradyrhizobium sp. CB1717]WFU28803.1 amidase family protein [Bradyrhizobium sp. CB1717]
MDEAGALKAAAAFDATGDKAKPLGGVPIVIKDNIEVAEAWPATVLSNLKRGEIWMNRHHALGCCWRMILPENRFALFRIMF